MTIITGDRFLANATSPVPHHPEIVQACLRAVAGLPAILFHADVPGITGGEVDPFRSGVTATDSRSSSPDGRRASWHLAALGYETWVPPRR